MNEGAYPITFEADLPNRVARWRPLVHWLLLIPQYIVLYLLGLVAGVVVIVAWLMAVFTATVPLGLARLLALYLRYSARVQAYSLFLHGTYPPFEFPDTMEDPAHQPVRVDVRPDQTGRNRLTIFFRLVMLIPQMLFGILIGIGIWFVSIIGWFAVIILGRWPAGLRDFAVGALRWSTRVNGYYLLLTDEYPPFSLD